MYKLTIIPFNYFIQTRLKGKIQKVSWIFVYLIPNIFLYLSVTGYDFSATNILIMAVGMTLINYIYENGYIQNDIILTKKENNPTLRIVGKQLDDIRTSINKILLLRSLVIVVLLLFMWILTYDHKVFFSYLIVLIVTQFVYLLYNNARSILNLYLILPLTYLRFYGFILPFVSFQYLAEFILLTLLLYPLSRMLEFTKSTKYNFPKLSSIIGNIDKFRVIYYSIILGTTAISFYYFNTSLVYIYISFYYLLFRVSTLIAIRSNKSIKNEMCKNTKAVYRK